MATLERFDFEEVEGVRVGVGNRINTSCIVYRIEDTVVDTGPANQWRHVRRFLEEHDVAQVLITHHHEDHAGNAAHIARYQKPKIYAHEEGLPLLERAVNLPMYRRLTWGKPKKFKAVSIPDRIEAGPLVLKPIHVPGHAPDHICLLETRRGWLFSGDAYIHPKPRFLRQGEDPNLEIESLQMLMGKHFDTLLCAHAGVVLNGYEALQAKLKYLVSLREQVCHCLKVGDSVREVCRRLLGKEEFLYYISGGEFGKRHYVEAFARHYHNKTYRSAAAREE